MFKVLIIEDCRVTSEIIKLAVEKTLGSNADVMQAYDLENAINLLDLMSYHLIFQDICLDSQDSGLKTLEYMFTEKKTDAHVAVCTSYYDKNIVEEFAKWPVDKYILKPIVTSEIERYFDRVFTKFVSTIMQDEAEESQED